MDSAAFLVLPDQPRLLTHLKQSAVFAKVDDQGCLGMAELAGKLSGHLS